MNKFIRASTFVKMMTVVFAVLAGTTITFILVTGRTQDRPSLAFEVLAIGAVVLLAVMSTLGVMGAIGVGSEKERKTAENERDAHEWTQEILDAAPMFIEIYDDELNLIECNQKTAEMLELERKEDYITHFERLAPEYQPCGTPSMEKYRILLKQALRKGFAQCEWMCLTLNNREQLPVDLALVRLKRDAKDVVVVYSHDLRQVKEAMLKVREANDESRAKTQFLARTSHEIRTPLNAVLGTAELQIQKGGHPLETEKAFMLIYSSSKLLLAIINDILDLSKIEAGKMEIIPAVYETTSLIVDTIQLNLIHAGNKNIRFDLNVDENLPTYLIGDELRVKQILNNLLSNAFKYTQEGVVELSVGVESSQTDDVIIVFSVRDTGQGMTEEQVGSLFSTEFTRFNTKDNYSIDGVGLGMYIVHQLAEKMNGDISVESSLGKGSIFTVRIPHKVHGGLVLGKEAAENLQNFEPTQGYTKHVPGFTHEPMPYGRVLAVDDMDSNLHVIKGLLLQYKIVAETAESGAGAIEKIKSGNVYDIIFMDYMMPGMDGIKTTKIIRDTGYAHPIVALTANALKDAEEQFMCNGFSGFLSKPIDVNKLDAYLLRFIRNKQPKSVIEAHRLAETQSADSVEQGGLHGSGLEEIFLREANKAIDIMASVNQNQALDRKSLENFTIQAHSIKSSLTTVGLPELANAAYDLEQAGHKEDIETIIAQTPAFLGKLRKICEEIVSSSEGRLRV